MQACSKELFSVGKIPFQQNISRPAGAVALIALMALGTGLPQTASAQSTANSTAAGRAQGNSAAVVRDGSPGSQDSDDSKRLDDSYQPKGVELGSFLMLPQVELSEVYNSNIYATESNTKGDLITKITPEVRFRSRLPVHSLNILARLDQSIYKNNSDDNHLDGVLLTDGRYDFTKEWEANGTAEVNQYYEDRGSPDDAGGKKPTRTRAAKANLGTKAQAGRFTFAGDVDVAQRDFKDVETSTGTVINNDDRDRNETSLSARAGYEFRTGYSVVVAGSTNWRRYDDKFDDQGYQRSSNGQRVETGLGVDITDLIRGEFLVGYMKQDYKDSRLNDPKGYSINASFNWTPSRMTVVVPSLERSVQETTVAGSSGIVRTAGTLVVRHELDRNLVVTAIGSVLRDNFRGDERADWTYDARLRGTLALAPEYYVSGELGYRDRTSTVDSAAFDQVVVALRFGLRI
jgi:hypothetical protein